MHLHCFRILFSILIFPGFYHEHTRSDRDSYVTIQRNNIKMLDAKIEAITGKKDTWKNNYKICTNRKYPCQDLKVGYDYESIMHYGRRLCDNNNIAPGKTCVDAIKPVKTGAKIGLRKRFSQKDIEGIQEHYGCPKGTNKQHTHTHTHTHF